MTDRILILDLSQAATRASIAQQLKDALGARAWHDIEQQAAQAGIDPDAHYHAAADVFALIDELAVSPEVSPRIANHMRQVYTVLAQAEAQVHDSTPDAVHFHEVGKGSALQNALVICMAFDALDADLVRATPVQTGSGTVECAHGLMDIPTPATRAILATGIPTCAELLDGELCTPTSAALIKHFVTEFVSDL